MGANIKILIHFSEVYTPPFPIEYKKVFMFHYNHATHAMQALYLTPLGAGADELLIAVKAIGVNRADILQKMGKYPLPEDANPILGLEVAGVVAQTSAHCQTFKVGDRVMSLCDGGAYASHVIVPTAYVWPIDDMDFTQAAALPEALMTLWHHLAPALQMHAHRHKTPAHILVRAASSGVGSLACMLLSHLGHHVVGTCKTLEKARAWAPYVPKAHILSQDELPAYVQEHGLRWDIVLDMLGGVYLEQAMQQAAKHAYIASIAFLSQRYANIDLARLLSQQIHLVGGMLRTQTIAHKSQLAQEIQNNILELFLKKTIKPYVHQIYPFSPAGVDAAHAALLTQAHMGKCILMLS